MRPFYHFWKIWLWIDECKKEIFGDFSVEILKKKNLVTNKDIAERLSNEGFEVSYSTLTYIIDQYDRVVRDMICEGYTIKTNNVIFTPNLVGRWSKEHLEFNPEEHKPTIICEPTQEIKQVVNSIGVSVLGFKDASSYISQVTDVESGEINTILTRGGDVIIQGHGIKALGKNGTATDCIFLMKVNKEMIDISSQISLNNPDQIILNLPSNIEKGKYSLLIHTYAFAQYSEKCTYLRCIEFDKTLLIK